MDEIEFFNEKVRIKMKKEYRSGRSLKQQLGSSYAHFLKSRPQYESFFDFLKDAGIPEEEIKTK